MGSSMLVWLGAISAVSGLSTNDRKRSANGKRQRLGFMLLGLVMLTVPVWAAGFKILTAATHLDQGVYRLDAKIDWQFSRAALEGLQNGVPLTLRVQMEVYRRRDWLWDALIAELRQRFRLEYHALARQYVMTNLNSGEFKIFPSRQAAIEFISEVNRFPLLDQSLLSPGEDYYVQLRARLDINALPPPLRPIAYLSEDWQLSSEWYECPL